MSNGRFGHTGAGLAAMTAMLVLCLGAAWGCVRPADDGSTVASPEAVATGDRTQEDRASDFFDAFPSKSYTSFEEAEAVAGYRIPRAGDAYPIGFGQTSLQWFAGNDVPVSHTEYTYQPMAPTSIGIAVGPSSIWAQKDGTSGEEILMMGEATVVGGKEGWEAESGFIFSYQCGSDDGEPIWCVVRATPKIGRAAFDEFVASIR